MAVLFSLALYTSKVPSHSAPSRARAVWISVGGIALLGVVVAGVAFAAAGSVSAAVRPSPTATTTATTVPTPSPTPTPTATPTKVSTSWNIDDPNSLTVVVNKQRPLNPQDFSPADLRTVNVPHTWEPMLRDEAATAVETMFAAASAEAGLSLASNSAYRSYTAQQNIYDGDDLSTARPGYSEHQTGLAIDIGAESGSCSLAQCFADTAEGQWLAANAWRYGFVLRYPAGQTDVTGYEFEPWHYRYIGPAAAEAYHAAGASTLEAFFGLPAAGSY